jgi:prophage antirepressor-like protein
MKLIRWNFRNLNVLMIEINGTLYCPSTALAVALNVTQHNLTMWAKSKHRNIRPLRIRDLEPGVQALISSNRDGFHIKRLKQDIALWSEKDMIRLACRSRSAIGEDFHEQFVTLIVENATRELMTKEQVKQLLEEQEARIHTSVRKELSELRQLVETLRPSAEAFASSAGFALSNHKKIKRSCPPN